MYKTIKRAFKNNSHNLLFKIIADFGRGINKLYENSNHDISCNGEIVVLKKLAKISAPIIIDGGANVGKYALLIHKYNTNSKIYALEPVDSSA